MQQPLELSQYMKVKTQQDKNLYLLEPSKIFVGTFKVFYLQPAVHWPPHWNQVDDQLQPN